MASFRIVGVAAYRRTRATTRGKSERRAAARRGLAAEARGDTRYGNEDDRTRTEPSQEEVIMSKARILIVDDDPDILRLLTFRLEGADYAVESADSAERALARLSVSTPQLVITDLRMSGMDGMALFENIHKSNPALPVIILTAHGTIPDAVAATQRGVFGYLTKPFDSKDLLQKVEKGVALSGGRTDKMSGDVDWRVEIIT